MIRLARLLAGLAIFGFFVWAAGRAADQELAAGGVLTGRAEVGGVEGASAKPGGIGNGIAGQEVGLAASARSVSACGASSIGPDGRVTVTVCGEGLSEWAAATAGSMSARSESLYQTHNSVPVRTAAPGKIQGRGILWWHRRAVQARKDANARGLTIRRLQTVARRQLTYPTGHWLDGAFLCIHRYERGADRWATNTGNGYRGGLQFDSSFARTYGPSWAFRAFGGVERWPASVQIAAAVQAWTSRSFGPWPSTRRMCGL